MIFVQYTDETKTIIASIFSCVQDSVVENQGTVELSDTRYKAFYDALPDQIKTTLPTPEEVRN